jgi:hypothetical protein
MDTSHGKIIVETEYIMLYDEESILLSESRLIKDKFYVCVSVHHKFSVIAAIWDNFLGLKYKPT